MEEDLIKNILAALKNEITVMIPFEVFLNLWKPKNEQIFSKKLFIFSRENNLDYITILDQVKRPIAIRLWKRKWEKIVDKPTKDFSVFSLSSINLLPMVIDQPPIIA